MTAKRNIIADILKGCGIITVILVHVFRGEGLIDTFIGEIGRWAVPAFFMIQGFYLHVAARKSWRDMAFKKIKKIYLPFILYSIAYGIYFYFFDGKEFTISNVILGETAVHLYYIPHYMIFALCLPFLYRLPKRYRTPFLWVMIGSNFAICLALELQRAYGIRLISYSGFNPLKWWGFVALGMWAAERPQFLKRIKSHPKVVVFCASCAAAFGLLFPYWMDRIGYMYNRFTLFPLAIGITLLMLSFFRYENIPGREILAYVGQRSFGIYLSHFYIVHVLKYVFQIEMLWLVAVLVIIICLLLLEGSKKIHENNSIFEGRG